MCSHVDSLPRRPAGMTTARPGQLAAPRPIDVRQAPDGSPELIGGQPVEQVRESWLVEDRWWSGQPLRRRYWEVVNASGANLVVFRELPHGGWFTHRRPGSGARGRTHPEGHRQVGTRTGRAARGGRAVDARPQIAARTPEPETKHAPGAARTPAPGALRQQGPSPPPYAELHCHSAYSFLDGASLPSELAERRTSWATARSRSPTTTGLGLDGVRPDRARARACARSTARRSSLDDGAT